MLVLGRVYDQEECAGSVVTYALKKNDIKLHKNPFPAHPWNPCSWGLELSECRPFKSSICRWWSGNGCFWNGIHAKVQCKYKEQQNNKQIRTLVCHQKGV